jgi:urea-proton symporter
LSCLDSRNSADNMFVIRYQHEVQTSEMFSTAGRTVKSGLVASAVVSSWTWAATLLQSSTVAYEYGVSGPFFYASGKIS